MVIGAMHSIANEPTEKEQVMTAKGTFEVNLDPQKDENSPAGRMLINKKYTGDLNGTGIGKMISKRTENGIAAYAAIEEFEGSVSGARGSFTLIHNGYMSSEVRSLEVKILKGSGKGELENISGSMEIIQREGKHDYILTYEL